MPHLMRSATMHACGVEDAVQPLADVRLVERGPGDRREDPLWKRPADGEPGGALSSAPEPQRGHELVRQVDAPTLVILGRRQDAAHQVPLHLDKAPAPVEVAPLQREQLTGTQARAEAAQQPGMEFRKPLSCDGDDVRCLVARERIDDWLGIVSAAQVPTEAQRGIRRQQLVFDRLRQNRAQRPRDAANR